MKTAEITTVKRGKLKGQFKFTLFAKNGEAVAQSYPETYTAKHNCVQTLMKHFAEFKIIDKTV